MKQELLLKNEEMVSMVWNAATRILASENLPKQALPFLLDPELLQDLMKNLKTACLALSANDCDQGRGHIWETAIRIIAAHPDEYLRSDRKTIVELVGHLKAAHTSISVVASASPSQTPTDGLLIITGKTREDRFNRLKEQVQVFQAFYRASSVIGVFDNDIDAHGIPGVAQIPVRPEEDKSRTISSSLRLDPDLVIVDEVETEKEAVAIVRAVETGHFVFITIPAADKQDGMDLWQKLIDGWADESLCKFLGS